MKSYRLKFVFDEKNNIETTIDSELEIKDFTNRFANQCQLDKFFGLYGEPTKIIINVNKILYYTIEEITNEL